MTEVLAVPTPLGTPPPDDVLLDVRDLRTYFHVLDGTVPAVDGVSYTLKRGRSLGIVGDNRIACTPIDAGSCMLRYG